MNLVYQNYYIKTTSLQNSISSSKVGLRERLRLFGFHNSFLLAIYAMANIDKVVTLVILLAFFNAMLLLVTIYPIHDITKDTYTSTRSLVTPQNSYPHTNQSEECSSVIVTGDATKDGRPILMKNRDSPEDLFNMPVYIPATTSSFAFVAVNTNAMGINERGLAVMNTAMPELEHEYGIGNLVLNRWILEKYESVEDVARDLNNSRSLIGPYYRSTAGAIATCIGVIDRFGAGAFFEISNTQAYVQYIVNGYDTRANHARIFPGLASGPSGRDQYLLDALDEIYEENGFITWSDVMQKSSRYVRDKELGSVSFSIDGEACNPNTGASMVAVSGDSRYNGKLNIMWGAYGITPLIGVFVPSMVVARETPAILGLMSSYTYQKWLSAQVQANPILLDPNRVQEIQNNAFYAEDYTIEEYEYLINQIPDGLSDNQLDAYTSEYVERVVGYAVDSYLQETTSIPVPPRGVITVTSTSTSSILDDTTTTITSTTSTTNNDAYWTTISQSTSVTLPNMNRVFLGAGIGLALVLVFTLSLKKRIS